MKAVATAAAETASARRRPAPTRREAGFTLLEMLVVLAIMGLLAAIIAPQVLKYLDRSRVQTAKVQVQNISQALELYRLDMGGYPSQSDGLQALVKAPVGAAAWNGPYLQRTTVLVDPWGQPYLYRNPGQHAAVDVYSHGPPGRSGDEADIGNW
ncbi:MAG TPA: type II secretion system major pseudopilin GspG [Caulobacteraceae bacterium]|nr:type II secretion system major pseudopilin GspG [Caulobacteraceae bacterium]